MDELVALDDLFLLSYYIPIGVEILRDPNAIVETPIPDNVILAIMQKEQTGSFPHEKVGQEGHPLSKNWSSLCMCARIMMMYAPMFSRMSLVLIGLPSS